MTVLLPQPLPVTSGWQLADWLDDTYTSPPAAADTMTLTLPQLDAGTMWQLTHMVASSTSQTQTHLRLYVDSVADVNFRDGTDSGNFDVADWAQFLVVRESRSLVAQWTGATPGAVGTLSLQGLVLRRSS